MPAVSELRRALRSCADPKKAEILARFFKTKKGQYGEGDVFLGVCVPDQRKIVQRYTTFSLIDIKQLLQSAIHEERLTALLILVAQFEKGDKEARKNIVDFYLANRGHVNNWDLVDLSAPKIVGAFLCDDRRCAPLFAMARSSNLWDRRIAIVATYALIRKGRFDVTLKLAARLLSDSQDLIHKAVGWMLREVGKKDKAALLKFLDQHAASMPRTMLRYAIEKFTASERKKYMTKSVTRLTGTPY